jgi:hypothetical protein
MAPSVHLPITSSLSPLAFSEFMVGTFRRPIPMPGGRPNILPGMVITPYLAAGGPAGGDPASLGPAVIVLGTIVVLLVLFGLGAVLLARSHRRDVRTADRKPPEPVTDAWQEAGRRLEPPDNGADD